MKKTISLLLSLILIIAAVPSSGFAEISTLEVSRMQTDHMTNPIGIDSEKPLFSWSLEDNSVRGQRQTAYRITVADSESKLNGGEYMWDSGRVESDETLDIEYAGDELQPSTRYFWNVTVWDKDGIGTASQTAYFETGLMDSGWSGAQWIGRSDTKKDGYFELTDFTLEFDVKLVSGAASILFGAEDDSNLYMWQISNMAGHGGGTRFRPHKCVGGSWSVMVNQQLSADTEYAADYIHMSVTSNGGTVVTKIGDNQIDSRSLGSFKLGYIGFRKQADEKALFDNIVLKDGSGNVVYSENFDDGVADGFSNLPVADGCAALNGDTTLGVLLRYGESRAESAPMFRKEFSTATGKTVAAARLYATSAGIYEFFINGGKTTDSYLNPGMTAYDDTLMYQTYDVTELVCDGKNAIGAYLGHGWFNKALHSYGSNIYLYAKLLVTYTDGTSEAIVTDNSWRFYRYGPILDDDIFNGYKYDATIEAELDGWTQPGFDDSGWDDVSVAAADKIIKNGSVPEIVAQNIPLIRNTITLPAIEMTEPEKGVYIYDFGQNIAGIARVTATAPAGTTMTLRHAEILNRENMQGATGATGTLYTGNLPRAEATDTYVFRGDADGETFEPTMTYHGFRYLEITGLDEPLPLENVKALLLMTDLDQTSTFDSSNDMVDRLYLNSLWSARDNFMSVPTDCPQRGERFGWTGDAQIFARTGAYMMDINAFYQKYCKDMRDASKDNRIIVDIAPPTAPGNGFYGKSTQNRLEATNGWGDAIIIIPYQMYKQYGNKKIIEENYEIMCNWMAYLVETSTDYIRDESWTGDWLPVNEAKTPIAVTDTAFCAYSASLLAEMAQVLGKTEDSAKYTELYNSYRSAWRSSFLAEDGCTTLCNTQTSYVLGLKFGLFDEAEKQGAAENLVKNIKSWDWHLTTGFLGLSYLNPVLSDNGYAEVAYKLLEQEEYPSWLYSVTTGSTTIWESWYALRVYANGSSKANGESFNHFSYGAVSEWLYRYMLGIERDDENSNSFKHFLLKPQFGGSFTHAKGSYQSPRGYIASGWELNKETGAFAYNATVPANTTATLYLPVRSADTAVYESGIAAADAEGVTYVEYADGHMVYELQSGSYSFATTADADMNSFASVKVENKQGIAATLTADGRTYTQFPANIISGNSKMSVSMVSDNAQYTFRNFVAADGSVIDSGDTISGDNDIDAVFAYTGTDDGTEGKKTVTINGAEGIEISVNGVTATLPYTAQFDKGADVEIKVLSVPVGYEFAGLEGIASLTDCAYIMPLRDITTSVNIANERYRKGYDIFFDFENSLEEWHGASSTVTITHKNDYMHFESLIKSDGTYDPRIYYIFYGDSASATGGQYLDADKYESITVGFTANEISADTTPCMFVSTEEQPVYTNPVRRLYATSPVTTDMADGELHEITFNVGSWSAWTGNIKDIYLDVVDNAYADLDIDYIKIKHRNPRLTVINNVTGAAADYSYLPGSTVNLTELAVEDGFLGYSLQAGSTDYITTVTLTDDVTVYANYVKIEDIVWDFEDNTSMGWSGLNTHSVDTTDGSLKLYYSSDAAKTDLWAHIENLEINASNYKYIVIEMRHNIPGDAFGSKPLEVFFKRSTDAKWGQQLSANAVQLPASTGYKKYVIDMSSCANWNGTISNLRIDPFEATPAENMGYWVELDSIRLCSTVEQRNVIYSLDTYNELAGTWGNAVYSSAAGTDGYEDTAIAAVSTSVKERNVFLSEPWDVSKFGDDKYVVYQIDVKFGPNGENFFVATNGHERISPVVSKTNPKIKTHEWNTITVVSEADGGATKVYINGIYDCSGKSYVTRDNYISTLNCVRFVTYAADESDLTNIVASYDNVLVYTTDVAPVLADELLTGTYSADSGATFTAACNYGVLVVAAYSGNIMLDVKYINITDKQNTLTLKVDGATEYIGYVWNSMIEIKPMCTSLPLDALNN